MRKINKLSRISFISLALLLIFSSVVYAATWEFKYPVYVGDSSSANRTYYPVNLKGGSGGISGDSLYAADKILVTGLDTNVQVGDTSIKYMIADDRVMAVIPFLPANGTQTVNLFTGYSPNQTTFPIITGDGGYITTLDAAALELGNNFEVEQNGYIDTSVGGLDYDLFIKGLNFKTWVSSVGVVSSGIPISMSPVDTSSSDGYLQYTDVVFATAHDAAVAEAVDSTDEFKIGQDLDTGLYAVYRAFVYFDTSSYRPGRSDQAKNKAREDQIAPCLY